MEIVAAALLAAASLGAWSLPSQPATDDPDLKPVQITNGPVVENVTDTAAVIAWSTNVNSGTVLFYGTDPRRLDETASMPWGGLTHRVNLKDLTPDTTYYYVAESPKAQGTGTMAQSPVQSFKTKPGAGCASACT
jgi:Purple acid Phosphatase, N-terminal domain